MLRYLVISTSLISILGCEPVLEQGGLKTPPPLTAAQLKEFKEFLVVISDQVGSHALVGVRDKPTQIKLSTTAEQIRGSLEKHGCKVDRRIEQKDVPNGQEVKNKAEMVGVGCPGYRVERQDWVSKNPETPNQMSVNGKISFLIKPNYGGLGELLYQANFIATQIPNPRGGNKTSYSSSGGGSIYYAGGRYDFKVGNDASHDSGTDNRQVSWWEFKMGAFTAVVEQDRGSCKVNKVNISNNDCAVMLTNIREVIDPVYFVN